MNMRKIVFSGVISLLSISGVMFSNFGPFYIQLQTAGNEVVNLLIDGIPLDFVNEGIQPVYINGEFSSFQNRTTCTVTFPSATSVQLKFANISQFGPSYPDSIHIHTFNNLKATNNQPINTSEITRVNVGLPTSGFAQGTMAGSIFPITETYPLFRYF